MKKVLSLVLACMLVVIALAACSDSSGSSSTTTGSSSANGDSSTSVSQSEDDGLWTGEVSKVVMTYLTQTATPTDLTAVQDAVNEITIPKIGVEVEYKPINAFEALSQFSLWIGSGERVDLMMLLLQDVKQYVDQGLIDPLDDLVAANAPYITSAMEEFPLAAGTYVDGQFYGITPVPNSYGVSGGMNIAKKYVDETDFVFDPDKIYTLDELGELLAAIKQNHPDMYPNVTTSLSAGGSLYSTAGGVTDMLGGTIASGVLMGKDSTTIVNLFATPEYEAFARTMRAWNQAGLSHPDAATTDFTNVEMVLSGVGAGYLIGGHPTLGGNIGGSEPAYLIQLSEPYVAAQGSTGSFWTVPFTAEEPEAAMRFLNMMYEDHDLSNLIMWGIEGEHYVMEDESIGLIAFPEGVDATTSGYYNSYGLYGDRRHEYVWEKESAADVLSAYSAKALVNTTKGVGYAYDASDKVAQIAAIQAILAEYVVSLDTGSVDVDTVLPEFIAKLESAGINEVIADNQAQFEAWLATQ